MSGSKEYTLWAFLKRKKRLAKEWHRSFEKFFSVVGKKPEGMRLVPINEKRLLGPDNWAWSTGEREVPKPIRRKLLAAKNRSNAIINARKAGYSLQEIGDVLGLTRERVRQIESRGSDWKPKVRGGPQKKTVERDKEIVKHFNDGLETEEIAKILNVTPEVISGRLAYLCAQCVVEPRKSRIQKRDEKIVKYYNDGLDVAETAKLLSIRRGTVFGRLRLLRAKGLVGPKRKLKRIRERDDKIAKYYNDGLRAREIVGILGVSYSTVLSSLQPLRAKGPVSPEFNVTTMDTKIAAKKKTKETTKKT